METKQLSSEEVAELKQMRRITQEEFDEFCSALIQNHKDYLDWARSRAANADELALFSEAADLVLNRHWQRLCRDFDSAQLGYPWLTVYTKFVGDCRFEVRRLRAANRSTLAAKVGDDGKRNPGLDEKPGSDEKPGTKQESVPREKYVGTETEFTEAPKSKHPRDLAQQTKDYEDAILDRLVPLTSALLPRIVEVLAERNDRAHLTPNQVEVVEVMLMAIRGRDTAPEHLKPLLGGFQVNLGNWRADLARIRQARHAGLPLPEATSPDYIPKPVPQSGVTNDFKAAMRQLRTCLYLFVSLAPPGRAVTERKQMATLLDAVYQPSGLNTVERLLLRTAGDAQRTAEIPRQAAQPWELDVDQLMHLTAKNEKLKDLEQPELVTLLHQAEERYARLVPAQSCHPPRFQCVLRCAQHWQEGD